MVFVYVIYVPFESSQIPRRMVERYPKDNPSTWVLAQVRQSCETGHFNIFNILYIFNDFNGTFLLVLEMLVIDHSLIVVGLLDWAPLNHSQGGLHTCE